MSDVSALDSLMSEHDEASPEVGPSKGYSELADFARHLQSDNARLQARVGELTKLVGNHICERYTGAQARDCAGRRARTHSDEPRCRWCDAVLSARKLLEAK